VCEEREERLSLSLFLFLFSAGRRVVLSLSSVSRERRDFLSLYFL